MALSLVPLTVVQALSARTDSWIERRQSTMLPFDLWRHSCVSLRLMQQVC